MHKLRQLNLVTLTCISTTLNALLKILSLDHLVLPMAIMIEAMERMLSTSFILISRRRLIRYHEIGLYYQL